MKGVEIKEHMKDKKPGDACAWEGEMDGVPFGVFAMNKPDNDLMMTSTLRSNEPMGEWKS